MELLKNNNIFIHYNSRLVVDEDDNGEPRFERVNESDAPGTYRRGGGGDALMNMDGGGGVLRIIDGYY